MRLVHLSLKTNKRHSDPQSTFEKLLPGNAAHITALRVMSFVYFNWNRNYSDIAYFVPQFQLGLVIVGFNIRPSIIHRFDGSSRDGRKHERQVREQLSSSLSKMFINWWGKRKWRLTFIRERRGKCPPADRSTESCAAQVVSPPPPRTRAVVQVAVCVHCRRASDWTAASPQNQCGWPDGWLHECLPFSYSFLVCVVALDCVLVVDSLLSI